MRAPTKNHSRNGQTKKKKFRVAKSGVHGRGVYATAAIRKGARIIEYAGRHLPWKEAMDLPPHRPDEPYHTFFFSIDNGDVIDANVGGNESRWINHSCAPNCETEEEDNRIFVSRCEILSRAKNYSTIIGSSRRSDAQKNWKKNSPVTARPRIAAAPCWNRRRRRKKRNRDAQHSVIEPHALPLT